MDGGGIDVFYGEAVLVRPGHAYPVLPPFCGTLIRNGEGEM
jgi:hypothetical protein